MADVDRVSNSSKKIDEEEEEERGNWGGKIEFFLSCLSQAVGLGNVWRFPYLAFKHGGGSFLIPYTFMLVVIAVPMLFLEMSLGQYSALGSLPLIKSLAPIFTGFGHAIIVRQFLSSVMYSAIISWTLFYFVMSMAKSLPWRFCDHDFNTLNCFDDRAYKECKSSNASNIYYDNKCYGEDEAIDHGINETLVADRRTASDEYFNLFVIGKTEGMEYFGTYQWRICLCYIACWVLIFLCCCKGIKTIGKVVYFTAVFPYVVLTILLIKGVMLDGAAEGIKYFITPKWDELASITVWQESAVQIFFSVGLASGSMMTFASYNKFNHKVARDSVLVAVINSITSILAGFVVFSVLGFMSKQLDKDINDVATKGPGLTFVVYPDALTRLPVAPLWAILFFFMLLTLGLGSQFGSVENAVTCIVDERPHLRPKKILILLIYCAISCCIGLILAFGNGVLIVDLYFSVSGWNYLILAFVEIVIVAYMYGLEKFFKDIEAMNNTKLSFFLKNHLSVLYSSVIPGVLIMTFLLIFIKYEPFKSDNYVYPTWASSIGWVMGIIPVLILLGFSLYKIFHDRQTSMKEHLKSLITATDVWENNYRKYKANEEAEINTVSNDMETKF